ncbi:hypothetical protein BCR43DRAFT_497626 [Syncephalastrum racemosum]|uniref:Uncharacterized protein n=1 Tax=Syncephalastrum racemosum TaxID=13706 RepID=A0A1X2H2I0_SYNRA|nr:hypothetical protein BCR43DRAFT_497626 [Syncephalastrum racemosum]
MDNVHLPSSKDLSPRVARCGQTNRQSTTRRETFASALMTGLPGERDDYRERDDRGCYTSQYAHHLPMPLDELIPIQHRYAMYGSSTVSGSDSSLAGTSISDREEEESQDNTASHPVTIRRKVYTSAASSIHDTAEDGSSIHNSKKSSHIHGHRSATSCPTAQSSYGYDDSAMFTASTVDPMSFRHFSVGSLPTKKPVPWPRRMALQHQQRSVALSPLEETIASPYAAGFPGKDDEDMIFSMED